jgi:hypothetical protein
VIDFSRIQNLQDGYTLPKESEETVVGSIVNLSNPTTLRLQPAEDSHAVVDLNIDGARRALRLFEDKVAVMEAEAQAIEVKTSAAAANATEMTGQTKRLAKSVDDRRKEIIAEPDSFVRKVNGFCKPIADRLKAIESLLKRKLADYAYQVELQRREIERKQNEARVELQKQVDAEAAAKGVESVTIAPVAMPTKKEPVRSDSAVSSAVMVWKHEVIDAAAVPREYLMVDDKAIAAAVKAGIRNVAGVRIFEEAEMRVRRVG